MFLLHRSHPLPRSATRAMAPTKRLRSPSPQLPLHLLTSLPSHSCPSTNNITTSLNPSQRLRLPPHLAHGIQAHEATVLTGFEELAGELEDAPEGKMKGEGGDEGRGTRGRRRVRWAGTFEREGEEEEEAVWTDRYAASFFSCLRRRRVEAVERRKWGATELLSMCTRMGRDEEDVRRESLLFFLSAGRRREEAELVEGVLRLASVGKTCRGGA